jgi:Membrane protein involved in the export of O-antigen and teichoic acid
MSDDQGDTDDSMTEDDAVRNVLRGAGVVYVGLLLEMFLAFLAQRFAAVYLSLESFGNLLSGTAVLDVGATLAGLGLASGLVRYLPRVDNPTKRVLAEYTVAISVVSSLVVSGLLYTTAEFVATVVFDAPSFATSFRVFAVVIPFAVLLELGVGGVRGQKVSRYRVYVKNITQPGTRFVLVMIAVVVGAEELGFLAGYAGAFVLPAVLAVMLFWRTLPSERDHETARELLPEFFEYSLPFTVSQLASFLYRSVDVFLLLYFVGSESVAAYGVAYALAQLVGAFSTAFSYLSGPISSQLENDDRIDEALSVQRTVARWLVIVSVGATVPMVVYAADFIRLVYRPAYAVAGPALAVLAVGFGLKNVLLTHGSIIDALGRSKLAAVNTTAAGVTNLAVNLVLIPRYGALGAGIATTVSFAVLGLLPTLEVQYLTGETALSRETLGPALLAVPVTAAAVPVMLAVPRTLFYTLGTSALFAGIYAVSVVVVVGFSETDVMVIRSVESEYDVSLGPLDAVVRRFS